MTKFSSNKIVIADWSKTHLFKFKWLKKHVFPNSKQPLTPLWYTGKT